MGDSTFSRLLSVISVIAAVERAALSEKPNCFSVGNHFSSGCDNLTLIPWNVVLGLGKVLGSLQSLPQHHEYPVNPSRTKSAPRARIASIFIGLGRLCIK